MSLYVASDILIAFEKLKKDFRELMDLGETEGSPFNPIKIEV